MRIAIITLPYFFDGEREIAIKMLERGTDYLHIRKPYATESDIEDFIKSTPSEFYHKIALHDHHHLAIKYSLGGVHLNSRNPNPPVGWQGRVSCSCHSLEEIEGIEGIEAIGEVNEMVKSEKNISIRNIDYHFLSPIFDSVSKSNYPSKFTIKQLEDAAKDGIISQRTFALSGVTLKKLPLLTSIGFGGAALLGEPWQIATEQSSELFEEYLKQLLMPRLT